MWSLLKVGKYAGRSLPQILFSDPDYFFWAVEKKVFQGRLATEAAELAWKARHIKIPKPDPENWCVEYFFTPENKFSWYHLIEAGRPPHVGSSITMRSKHIDMSVVREFMPLRQERVQTLRQNHEAPFVWKFRYQNDSGEVRRIL